MYRGNVSETNMMMERRARLRCVGRSIVRAKKRKAAKGWRKRLAQEAGARGGETRQEKGDEGGDSECTS
jgi:hypothetical protein